jgi:hypothetical protein
VTVPENVTGKLENLVMSTSGERMRRLRERQTAQLEAVPDPPEAAPGPMTAEVVRTLAALKLGDRQAAQAQLAREYAAVIDAARDRAAALARIGPPLARVLAELARAAGRGRPEQAARPNKVAQLRAAHMNSPAKRRRLGV